MQSNLLEKFNSKIESIIDSLESHPVESIIKVVLLYVVFKQLFKKNA